MQGNCNYYYAAAAQAPPVHRSPPQTVGCACPPPRPPPPPDRWSALFSRGSWSRCWQSTATRGCMPRGRAGVCVCVCVVVVGRGGVAGGVGGGRCCVACLCHSKPRAALRGERSVGHQLPLLPPPAPASLHTRTHRRTAGGPCSATSSCALLIRSRHAHRHAAPAAPCSSSVAASLQARRPAVGARGRHRAAIPQGALGAAGQQGACRRRLQGGRGREADMCGRQAGRVRELWRAGRRGAPPGQGCQHSGVSTGGKCYSISCGSVFHASPRPPPANRVQAVRFADVVPPALSGAKFWEAVKKREDGALLALLRDRASGRSLLAGCTHLYYDPRFPDIKVGGCPRGQSLFGCAGSVAWDGGVPPPPPPYATTHLPRHHRGCWGKLGRRTCVTPFASSCSTTRPAPPAPPPSRPPPPPRARPAAGPVLAAVPRCGHLPAGAARAGGPGPRAAGGSSARDSLWGLQLAGGQAPLGCV